MASVRKKIAWGIGGVVVAACGAAIYGAWRTEQQVEALVGAQVAAEISAVQRSLGDFDHLLGERIQAAVTLLEQRANRQGPPQLGPRIKAGSTDTVTLRFGDQVIDGDHTLVDGVTALMGGT